MTRGKPPPAQPLKTSRLFERERPTLPDAFHHEPRRTTGRSSMGLRQARCRGLAKTGLQSMATAAARKFVAAVPIPPTSDRGYSDLPT